MSLILGLTGSIGMGKSTTTGFFREAGVPVWDADAAVHSLYVPDGAAVQPLGALHPSAVRNGAIDRAALRDWIARDPTALQQIEAIVHPLVAASRAGFIAAHPDAPLLVVDVPLLFETGGDRYVDASLVVTAPPEVQRARVLARAGMTDEHFRTILSKQMPDAEKRARATHVIETLTLDQTRAAVFDLIEQLTGTRPDA
ncbi:MAG: dephospho-CoA kinase [Rhodobacteraceae bacterium]|nr:dephospho-CoA kinase [Paracoccaceae bacterium]